MSVCLGCVLALSSFASVYGLGRATSLVTGLRRARAMQRVEDEYASAQQVSDPTEPTPAIAERTAEGSPQRGAEPPPQSLVPRAPVPA
jgi:hypothetical protein